MTKKQLSTLILTVQNKPGVLYRISGVIRKRRYNISSLTVSATENPDVSRFTIVVEGDRQVVQKMSNQLNKVIEVIDVNDPNEAEIFASELGLFKVGAKTSVEKNAVESISAKYGAKIVEYCDKYLILEITGNEDKIDKLHNSLKKYGVMEFVRTGRTALFR
jgi:acetolactate synthase-1/3 small subunit